MSGQELGVRGLRLHPDFLVVIRECKENMLPIYFPLFLNPRKQRRNLISKDALLLGDELFCVHWLLYGLRVAILVIKVVRRAARFDFIFKP